MGSTPHQLQTFLKHYKLKEMTPFVPIAVDAHVVHPSTWQGHLSQGLAR